MIHKRGGPNGNSIEVQLKTSIVEKVVQSINKNNFIISPRIKNKQFMRKFRLKPSAIRKILLDLDYSSFVKIDDDRNKDEYGEGPIIVFLINKTLINFNGESEKVKIYIKIKLLENEIIPIISFHEAEF